jgi:hypothetical protein
MGSNTIVNLVVQYLEDRQFQRGPYKTKDALVKAKTAGATNTEKIIVDESEPAWLAYHIVKKGAQSTHGFEGRAKLARLLDTLDTQSVEQRQLFARQLAMNLPANSPQPIVAGENDTSGRGLKRHRAYFAFWPVARLTSLRQRARECYFSYSREHNIGPWQLLVLLYASNNRSSKLSGRFICSDYDNVDVRSQQPAVLLHTTSISQFNPSRRFACKCQTQSVQGPVT